MKWWTIVAELFGIRLQTPGRVGKLENVGANPIGKGEIVLPCNGFRKDGRRSTRERVEDELGDASLDVV
jgi:hypothetical protein